MAILGGFVPFLQMFLILSIFIVFLWRWGCFVLLFLSMHCVSAMVMIMVKVNKLLFFGLLAKKGEVVKMLKINPFVRQHWLWRWKDNILLNLNVDQYLPLVLWITDKSFYLYYFIWWHHNEIILSVLMSAIDLNAVCANTNINTVL